MVSIAFQVAEQGVVGFQAFAESDAWVQDDLLVAVGFESLTLFFEEVEDGLVDVAIESILVHGLWGAYAVHPLMPAKIEAGLAEL